MLGLWEVGTVPQRLSLHLAFTMELDDLLMAPARLRAAGVTPRDFSGNPSDEPVVLAWMPAASLFSAIRTATFSSFVQCCLTPLNPICYGWPRQQRRGRAPTGRLDAVRLENVDSGARG